ncbi:MAG: hypothetical protein ABII27_06295, partial [bacterium]
MGFNKSLIKNAYSIIEDRKLSKRIISCFFIFAIAILIITANLQKLNSATDLGTGFTHYSYARNIVQNGWGIWVFYNNDGTFSYRYFDFNSWDEPVEVMNDTALEGGNGSVWYVASSSQVYVVCDPATYPSVQYDASYLYCRRGLLTSDGSITWQTSTTETRDLTKNDGKDIIQNPTYPTITYNSGDGGIWIAWGYREFNQINKSRTGVTRGTSFSNFASPTECPVGDDANLGADEGAIFPISASGDIGVLQMRVDTCNIYPLSTSFIWGAKREMTKVPIAGDPDYMLPGVASPDQDGRVFTAFCRDDNNLYYSERKEDGSDAGRKLINNVDTPWENISVALAGLDEQDDVYVVACDSSSIIRVFKVAYNGGDGYHTTISELASNKWAPRGGDKPNVIYQGLEPPKPLPVVYEYGTNIYFDYIVTSTYDPPGLDYIKDPQEETDPSSVGASFSGDVEFYGEGFQDQSFGNISAAFFLSGTTTPDPNISVSSATYHTASSGTITFSVSNNVAAGYKDIRLTNPDAQNTNVIISSFIITVPISGIIEPVSVNYSSGVAIINGTAGINPVFSPAETGVAQVRITLENDPNGGDDGYTFTGSGWTSADMWLNVAPTNPSSSTWQYTAWGAAYQEDVHEYKIEVRGKSSDQGIGPVTSDVQMTIDKKAPLVSFTQPAANSSQGTSFSAIAGTASDIDASGVNTIELFVADTRGTVETADDYTWTGSGWSAPGAINWFDSPGDTPVGEPDNVTPATFNLFNTDGEWPSFTNGGKYRIMIRATDDLVQMSTASATEREFYYDVSRPTVAFISPPNPLGPDVPNATWKNSLTTISGTISDNVVDNVIGKRYMYLKITEQGGSPLWNWHEKEITPSVSTAAWYIDVSTTNWQNGYWYHVEMYAKDAAGNQHGSEGSPVENGYFYYDEIDPDVAIVYPEHSEPSYSYGADSLATISGTSSDSHSGIDYVEYSLTYAADAYWNSDTETWYDPFPDTDKWNVAGTTTTIPYEIWLATGINFAAANGQEFSLKVRAIDVAGNVLQYSTTVQFKYDESAPQVDVVHPPSDGSTYVEKLSVISGTAKDYPLTGKQSGIPSSGVKIKIQRTSDDKWWKQATASWQSAVATNTANLSGLDWSLSFDEDAFFNTSSDTFKIWNWAFDNVTKPDLTYQNIGDSTTIVRQFNYESLKPSSTITVPSVEWADSGSYFNKSGNTLPTISGTAIDYPTTGGAGLWKVLIEVVDLGPNGVSGGGDDLWFNPITFQFDSYTILESTHDVLIDGLPWYRSIPVANYISSAGRKIRVRTRAVDNGLDENNDKLGNWEDASNKINDDVSDADSNARFFVIDTTAPVAVITYPFENTNELTTISGTANDANGFAGQGAGVTEVKVAYYSNTDTKFWDPGPKTFTLAGDPNSPPAGAYVPAELSGTDWYVTGSSVPSFNNDQTYQIYAKTKDKAQNVSSIPGSAAFGTARVQVTVPSPVPESAIKYPGVGTPHFKSAALTLITGTATTATTAQLRISYIDTGTTYYWDGDSWETGDTFVGVDTYVNPDWTFGMSAGEWNEGFLYKVESKAFFDATPEASPFEYREFVIDDTNPSGSPIYDISTSTNTLTTIYGTASDNSPGALNDTDPINYKIIRSVDAAEWKTATSTFVPAGTGSFLAASQDGPNWTYTDGDIGSDTPWVNGRKYKIKMYVKDKAENEPNFEKEFIYDVAKPTAAIVLPVADLFVSELNTISGTVADPDPDGGLSGYFASNSTSVYITIQNITTGGYYNGSDFTGSQSQWHSCTMYTSSWVFSPAGFNDLLASGSKYSMWTKAKDKANNSQTNFQVGLSSLTITVDKEGPLSGITSPTEGEKYTPAAVNAASISGTAQDKPDTNKADLLIDGIDVQMSFLSGGSTYYWNGSTWTLTVTTLTANGASWNFLAMPNATQWSYPGDQNFRVKVRARDDATLGDGTLNSSIGNWTGFRSFIVDNTAPLSGITVPSNSTVNALPTISGTANADLSGTDQVQVTIKRIANPADNYYWTGAVWDSDIFWLDTTEIAGGTEWYTTTVPSWVTDTIYRITSKVTDNAGNEEESPASFDVKFDTTTPQIYLQSPKGQFYNDAGQTLVTISGTASDPGVNPSTISQIEIFVVDISSNPDEYFEGSTFTATVNYVVTADTPNWTYTDGDLVWKDQRQYQVSARARDVAGNIIYSSSNTFKYDTSEPASGLIIPSTSYYKTIEQLSGTANDPYTVKSDIDYVEIAIQRVSGGKWWDGITDVDFDEDTAVYTKATYSGGNWTQDCSSVTWINGEEFTVVSRAIDRASNTQLPGDEYKFVYDNYVSTSLITLPVDNNSYSSSALATISGTATDNPGGGKLFSGIDTVEAVLKNQTLGSFWDGNYPGSFTSSTTLPSVWVAVNDTATWHIDLPNLNNNQSYRIWTRGNDEAGNENPDPDFTANAPVEFTYDSQDPVSLIIDPPDEGYKKVGFTTISGTASDGTGSSGIQEIRVNIKRSDNQYWNGSAWQGADPNYPFIAILSVDDPVTKTYTWYYTGAELSGAWSNNYQYTIYSKSLDYASNEETPAQINFIFDNSQPDSAVVLPAHNGFKNSLETISGTSNDPNTYRSTVESVFISIYNRTTTKYWNGSDFTTATTQYMNACVSTNPWTFTFNDNDWTNNVTYDICVKAVDVVGNVETTLSTNTFTFDTDEPLSLTILPADSADIPSLPTLSGTAYEETPGQLDVVQVCIKDNDNTGLYYDGEGFTSAEEVWLSSGIVNHVNIATWTYVVGDIWSAHVPPYTYTIKSRALDKAGNITAVVDREAGNTFNFTEPAPTSNVTSPAHNTYKNTLSWVQGNCSNASSIDVLITRIEGGTTPQYWINSSEQWSSTLTWNTGISPVGNSWTFTFSTDTWMVDGYRYNAKSRAHSPGEQVETEGAGNNYWIDKTKPTGGVELPQDDGYYNTLTLLSGTATDDSPGQVDYVNISINRLSDNNYWDGDSWEVGETYLGESEGVTGINPWQYSIAVESDIWTNDVEYTVNTKAVDKAVNAGTVQSGPSTFLYDIQKATAAIQQPIHNQFLRTLTTISGTAADFGSGDKLYQVKLRIFNNYTQKYWNGDYDSGTGRYQYEEYWNVVNSTSNWYYTHSNLVFSSSRTYTVVSKAVDKAGNQQSLFTISQSSVTFTYDTDPPISVITNIDQNGKYKPNDLNGTNAIVGTAVDPYSPYCADLDSVEVQLLYLDGGTSYYWDPDTDVFSNSIPSTTYAQAISTDNWHFPFDEADWVSDKNYKVRTRAYDKANIPKATVDGNVEEQSTYIDFIVDDSTPVSRVVLPQAGSYVSELPTISGTSNADLSGLDNITIRIYYVDGDTYYWTGSAWSSAAVSNLNCSKSGVTGTVTWEYPTGGDSPPQLTEGVNYYIRSAAVDLAGNSEGYPQVISFNYDNVDSTPVVVLPVTDEYYGGTGRTLATISGTSVDTHSGVSEVQISIKDGSNYWNGSSFIGVSTWVVAAATNPWEYTDTPNWDGNKVYVIYARALDKAGNLCNHTTTQFTYDVQFPTSTIQKPASSYLSSLETISGTAAENTTGNHSGLSKVQLSIEKSPGSNNYWNSGSEQFQVGSEIWIDASNVTPGANTANWYFTGSTPTWQNGVSYKVRAQAIDRANVIESPAQEHTFTYDNYGPTVDIVIPVEADRYSGLISISGTSNDTSGGTEDSEIAEVQLRIYSANVHYKYWNGISFSETDPNSAWNVATPSITWAVWYATYTPTIWGAVDQGNEYRVEARALDNAGNYTIVYSTITFIHDKKAPESLVQYPVDDSTIKGLTTISGTASDNGDGEGGVMLETQIAVRRNSDNYWWDLNAFSSDGAAVWNAVGGSASDWYYTSISTGNLTSGSSYYSTTKSRDNSNPSNWESPYHIRSSTFTFDNTPPVSDVIVPSTTYSKSMPVLSGTVTDATSGMDYVEVSIRRSGDSYWWDGDGTANWVSSGSPVYVHHSSLSGSTWTYTVPGSGDLIWNHNYTYTIKSRGVDTPGNVENASVKGGTAFTYDVIKPTSVVTRPTSGGYYNNTTNTLLTISGTATDSLAGVSLVRFSIKEVASGNWWKESASTFSATSEEFLDMTNSESNIWISTAPALQNGLQYLVKMKATDVAGN